MQRCTSVAAAAAVVAAVVAAAVAYGAVKQQRCCSGQARVGIFALALGPTRRAAQPPDLCIAALFEAD